MKWRRRLVRALAVVLALAVLFGAGGYFWLRTSLPRTAGTIEVSGLYAAVEIRRDGDGIVTIRAQNETDAAFALGFAHAQDRLFQMDFMRRIGAGRLSEILGEATLNTDQFMRILGLYRAAEANLATVSPELRKTLDAYSAGVNAYLGSRHLALPPEFSLLRYRPEPWLPTDSLVWAKLMAFQLSGNWSDELLRYRLAQRLTPEQLQQLWPAPANDPALPIATKPDGNAARTQPNDPVLASLLERPLGASNSFVLSGARTVSGKPILGNDPHLSLQSPSQWYLTRIETPDLTLAGITAPGVPQVIIGHNGRVAWSFTTTQGDTQDLFLEKLSPEQPGRYVTPSGVSPFETRQETIKVKGGDDVVVTLRQSHHGPILSDAPGLDWNDPNHVMALAWPALNVDDGTATALFRMNRASNAAEIKSILRDFDSPQQNILFGDVGGNIGFVAAGRVPLRKAIHAASQMPAPGWTGAYDWIGYLPYEALPSSFNPPQGWIATANNKIVDDAYPHFIAGRWEPPYRIDRLRQLIAATPKHDVATAADIQLDTFSSGAKNLASSTLFMLRGGTISSAERKSLSERMTVWDGRVTRDRAEPLLFWAWMTEFNRLVFSDDLGDLFEKFPVWDFVSPDDLYLSNDSIWCDDSESTEIESCAFQGQLALSTVIERLSNAYGRDSTNWRWGDAHQARFPHPLFDRIPVLRDLVHWPIATDGDDFTLNRGTFQSAAGAVEFPHVHGPSLRAIFDFSDLDNSRFIIAGGQSGNPLSPHYGDLVERWRDGEYLSIVGGGNQVLTLAPASAGTD